MTRAAGGNLLALSLATAVSVAAQAADEIKSGKWEFTTLCCTDQQPGAVSPPQRHLREANVLRPAKLEHAVQRGGSNGHLGRLPPFGP